LQCPAWGAANTAATTIDDITIAIFMIASFSTIRVTVWPGIQGAYSEVSPSGKLCAKSFLLDQKNAD
jgi:hypothetical protein